MYRLQLTKGSFWWMTFNINAMIEFAEIMQISLDSVESYVNENLTKPHVLRAYMYTSLKEGNRIKGVSFDYQNELDFFAECESEIPNLLAQINSRVTAEAERENAQQKKTKTTAKKSAKSKAKS